MADWAAPTLAFPDASADCKGGSGVVQRGLGLLHLEVVLLDLGGREARRPCLTSTSRSAFTVAWSAASCVCSDGITPGSPGPGPA